MNPSTPPPLTAATDAATLARLRALPPADVDALLDALDALPDAGSRQDHLIGAHRAALSLPALADWTHELRAARRERRFGEFLDDVRRAAERAGAFGELLARAERLHQVNVALLAARLFDALVARDHAAIESFARTFAEVVAGGCEPLRVAGCDGAARRCGLRVAGCDAPAARCDETPPDP